MNYFEAFENIKSGIKKVETKDFDGNFAIQLTITNKDSGGIFYIEYKDGSLNVESYDYQDRDVAITSGYADLLKVLGGKLSLNSKKIEISGNKDILEKFISTIEFEEPKKAPQKPAPAKRTCAKKSTSKAEESEKKTTKKSK